MRTIILLLTMYFLINLYLTGSRAVKPKDGRTVNKAVVIPTIFDDEFNPKDSEVKIRINEVEYRADHNNKLVKVVNNIEDCADGTCSIQK